MLWYVYLFDYVFERNQLNGEVIVLKRKNERLLALLLKAVGNR